MRVFAFLNLEHPPVAWAVMRGMMVSADQALAVASSGVISFMVAGMIEWENNARLYNESLIEHVRASSFPDCISRIRGLYFFESRAEAKARIGDPDWPPYFSEGNLLELELYPAGTPTKVDANWITLAAALLMDDGRLKTDDLSWIDKYWSGQASGESPVWELLANGVALVLDEQVRRRCDQIVRTTFPECNTAILMARLASEVGARGGLITPFLLRKDSQHVELQYRWVDSDFQDQEVIGAIAAHPNAGVLGGLMRETEEYRLPDFTPWKRVLRMGLQQS